MQVEWTGLHHLFSAAGRHITWMHSVTSVSVCIHRYLSVTIPCPALASAASCATVGPAFFTAAAAAAAAAVSAAAAPADLAVSAVPLLLAGSPLPSVDAAP